MAKRRILKKRINDVCEALVIECMSVKQNSPSVQNIDLENIVKSILIMQCDFTSRLSHVDKTQVKRFFYQLKDDLTVSTNEIIDHIYHL